MKSLFFSSILALSLGVAAQPTNSGDVVARSFDLEGSVTFDDGLPADGAGVRCQQQNGTVIAAATVGENGRFRLSGLSLTEGSYDFVAELLNVTAVERITVTRDSPSILRLPLILPVSSPAQKGEGDNALVRVFYATDRALSSGPLLDYTERRGPGEELSYGYCDVSIPRDHRLAAIERPTIWRFEFSEDPNKHILIRNGKQLAHEVFLRELSTVVGRSDGHELVVFVHGYNVTFKDAIYRTGQIAYDLGLDGAPVAYSWPSNGKLLSYVQDSNNARWTVQHLRSFLTELAARSHAKAIHLIAHSMGNVALTQALADLAATPGPSVHFNQVMLTAPDVDRDTFMQIAASVKRTSAHITIYASSNDRALQISKRLNGYPRVGDSGSPIVIVPGMDTVDVSNLDTDLVGHSYYGDSRSVLSDIFDVLSSGSPPQKRFGLRLMSQNGLTYWRALP